MKRYRVQLPGNQAREVEAVSSFEATAKYNVMMGIRGTRHVYRVDEIAPVDPPAPAPVAHVESQPAKRGPGRPRKAHDQPTPAPAPVVEEPPAEQPQQPAPADDPLS
jgi:hypothetical protein